MNSSGQNDLKEVREEKGTIKHIRKPFSVVSF
jgi:hypothetical protein